MRRSYWKHEEVVRNSKAPNSGDKGAGYNETYFPEEFQCDVQEQDNFRRDNSLSMFSSSKMEKHYSVTTRFRISCLINF
jgi:hypothetical protein